MQYSKQFYTNVTLFILALVVLGLSIWAIVAPCKKDKFGGEILSAKDCYNNNLEEEEIDNCKKTMEALSNNIEAQYEGLSANRGLKNPGGALSGSFGNSNILK
jgi:hypothetical protein